MRASLTIICCVSVLTAFISNAWCGENMTGQAEKVMALFMDGDVSADQAEERLLRIVQKSPDGPEREGACRLLAGVVFTCTGSLRETELALLQMNALDGVRGSFASGMQALRSQSGSTIRVSPMPLPETGRSPTVAPVSLDETKIARVKASQSDLPRDLAAPETGTPVSASNNLAVRVGLIPAFAEAVTGKQRDSRILPDGKFRVQREAVSLPRMDLKAKTVNPDATDSVRCASLDIPFSNRNQASFCLSPRDVLGSPKKTSAFRPVRIRVEAKPLTPSGGLVAFGSDRRKRRRRKKNDPTIQIGHAETRILLALMEQEIHPSQVDAEGARKALGICARLLSTPLVRDTRDSVVFKAWAYHKREDDANTFDTFSHWLGRHYRPGSEVEHTILMARIANEAGDYEACLERVAPYLDGRKEGIARDQCLLMAGVSCAKLNRTDEAKSHLSRLLDEHTDSTLRPKAMLLLGWMALVDGNEDKAAGHMNDILRGYPKNPVAEKARQLLQGIESRRVRKKSVSDNERETF